MNAFGRKKPRLASMPDVYFGQGGLLCEQCAAVEPVGDLEPFSFHPCPRCGFKNFVPLLVSDFLLFRPIGAGGLSSVYKAYRRDQGEACYAVKLLKPEHLTNEEAVEAFLGECEVHRHIAPHPNVVTYVDGGRDDGHYYYAMTFVEGKPLLSYLEHQGKLTEHETLYVTAQVVAGLQHIYASGYLYRDLNAGNIIMNDRWDVMLVDFGFAKTIEEAAAADTPDHIWGTGEFLPPERIFGQSETPASILYSLGHLMYYMLTGDILIKSNSMEGQARRHVSDIRVAITPDRFPDVSEGTMELVVTMFQPEPGDRYQTFEEAEAAVLNQLGQFSD